MYILSGPHNEKMPLRLGAGLPAHLMKSAEKDLGSCVTIFESVMSIDHHGQ